MKRILSLLILLGSVAICNAQTLVVFLQDYDGNHTNIRTAPKGSVKTVLHNIHTTSYAFTLTAPVNGWWKVVGCWDAEMDREIRAARGGYIHNSCIAVGTRNYGGEKLYLRSSASSSASVVYTMKYEVLLRPLDISRNGAWVKAKTLDGKHTGWIEVEWLCGNPLTTCL